MTKKTRITRQKRLIENKLNEIDKLFTAEELLSEVRKEDKNVGIATVYRFLKDRARKEHIHSYECNRRKIYSAKTDNHCHFICEKCHKIEHFNVSKVEFLKGKIKGDICHFQIDVYGICEKCKEANGISS